MNLAEIIEELRFEQERIDEAIQALTDLQTLRPKRRGRPRKFLAPASATGTGELHDKATRPRQRSAVVGRSQE